MANPRIKHMALSLGLCVCALLATTPVRAESEAARRGGLTIEQIEVGIGGYYKVGCWTPIEVTVHVDRPRKVRLVVEAPDPDGDTTILPAEVEHLATAGPHRLRGVFKSGRLGGRPSVRIVDGAAPVDEASTLAFQETPDFRGGARAALRQSAFLIATVGEPAGFPDLASATDEARSGQASGAETSVRVVELDDDSRLPVDSRGYDAVNAVVVAGDYGLDERRHRALREWVQSGGHLLVSVGKRTGAYQQSRFAEWAPVKVGERRHLRDLRPLESFAGRSGRILFTGQVPATQIDVPEGNVLVSGFYGPLIAEVPAGFGRVTFCGVDLDRPPLSAWDGLPAVCRRLLEIADKSAEQDDGGDRGRLAHTGISDLATQLHATQEHFPDVQRLSSWHVLGMMFLYLLLIGPLDYLLVHRLLKKPRLTWLTFPVWVVVAVALAAWGARATNGGSLQANQIDVVDIDTTRNTLLAHSWLTVYSPQTRRYRMQVEPLTPTWNSRTDGEDTADEATHADLAWEGIPENVYSGMYRAGGLRLNQRSYRFAAGASAIENLPVTLWSTKSLKARWQHAASQPLVDSALAGSGISRLSGTLTHHLPGELHDWMLAYGNRVYLPRNETVTIAPDRAWSPDRPGVYQRELRHYLTGARARRVEGGAGQETDEIRIEPTDYDPVRRDAAYVLRMLTFHEAVGGKSYTGLDNDSWHRLDLSRMLRLDRAVLFGRLDQSAARLKIEPAPDGATGRRTQTFVRILIPIEEGEQGPRELAGSED